MAQTVQMEKQPGWVTLESNGTRLFAPGLRGDVVWNAPQEHIRLATLAAAAPGSPESADPVEEALREAGLEDHGSASLAAGAASLPDEPTKIVFDRAIPPDEIEFAIYRDESGVISLHRPLPSPPTTALLAAGTPSQSTPRSFHFVIPLRHAPTPVGGAPRTAMLGGIVGKVVRFVGRKVSGAVTGLIKDSVFLAAKAWEDHYRSAQGFHKGATAAELINPVPVALATSDWEALQGQKTLLFIHGTISSTAGAFGGIEQFPIQANELFGKYQNRVIGFNHHTLTKSVAQNAGDFFSKLPQGSFNFDVICHSRGGLLGRALKQLPAANLGQLTNPTWSPPAGVNVQIDKMAMVAAPNVGTPLANPMDLPDAVSRLASMATSFSQVAATVGLGALLAIFGGIVEGGLGALPGLEDMNPGNPFLTLLNATSPSGNSAYFAIEADFQPSGGLARAIENNGVDSLFLGQENDLVVPTLGVSQVNGQTLPASQIDAYPQSANVYHTDFFWQQGTWDAILNFL
jgi:hypothetical protein